MLLKENTGIDSILKEALCCASFCRQFISCFSEEAIDMIAADLITVYGWDRVVWGLILDPREEVSEIGFEQIRNHDTAVFEVTDHAVAQAKLSIKNHMRFFFEHISSIQTGVETLDDSMTGIDYKKQLSVLEQKLAESEERLAKNLTSRSIVRKLEKKVSCLEQDNSRLSAYCSGEIKKREEAHGLQLQAEQAYSVLKDEFNHEVNQQVLDQVSDRVRPWLTPVEAIASKVDDLSTSTLDDKVANALKKQAERDKKFGTISQLKAREGELKTMLAQINSARTDSLRPSHDLVFLADKVENEIVDLQKTLGSYNPFDSETYAFICRSINESANLEALHSLQTFAVDLENKGLLTTRQKREIDNFINCKIKLEFDRHQPETPGVGSIEFGQSSTDSRTLFILDGHNILHKMADTFDMAHEPDSRKKLVSMVQDSFACKDDVEVMLYFDGPFHSETSHAPNFREIYSGGGQDDQRADTAILQYMDYMKIQENDDRSVYLVTDDHVWVKRQKNTGPKQCTRQCFNRLLAPEM